MRSHEIIPHLKEILQKLFKKDKVLYERVLKKIEEIVNSPDVEHYKNLRQDMKDKRRVHVGHFVLVFQYLKDEDKIRFIDFDHHDNIYLK
jgi:YafQ family addiction module toxin component